jgi:hypothetical protein
MNSLLRGECPEKMLLTQMETPEGRCGCRFPKRVLAELATDGKPFRNTAT